MISDWNDESEMILFLSCSNVMYYLSVEKTISD